MEKEHLGYNYLGQPVYLVGKNFTDRLTFDSLNNAWIGFSQENAAQFLVATDEKSFELCVSSFLDFHEKNPYKTNIKEFLYTISTSNKFDNLIQKKKNELFLKKWFSLINFKNLPNYIDNLLIDASRLNINIKSYLLIILESNRFLIENEDFFSPIVNKLDKSFVAKINFSGKEHCVLDIYSPDYINSYGFFINEQKINITRPHRKFLFTEIKKEIICFSPLYSKTEQYVISSATDYINFIKKNIVQDEGELSYPYIIQPEENTNKVYSPPNLFSAQRARNYIIKKELGDNVEQFIENNTGLSLAKIKKILAPEQIDAIIIMLYKLLIEDKKGFILGDTTGLGKGRMLSTAILWGLTKGKNVIFFTERSQLFTDIYRDILDVGASDMVGIPYILHQNAKIYDKNGLVKYKFLPSYKQKNILNSKSRPKEFGNLILTTYSQFNRKIKNNPKIEWVKSLENVVLIFDESHNAAGTSNTYQNMLELIEHSEKVVFSSATFVKYPQNLPLYQIASPFTDKQYNNLIHIFSNGGFAEDNLPLWLTETGYFLRREHAINVLSPQNIVLDTGTQDKKIIIEKFHLFLQRLYRFSQMIEKKMVDTGEKEYVSPWLYLGGHISRLSKQFFLLLKLKESIEFIIKKLSENKKLVIVLESTFESVLKNIVDKSLIEGNEEDLTIDEKTSEKTYVNLGFSEIFKILIESVCSQDWLVQYANQEILNEHALLIGDTSFFDLLPLSPIDYIKHKLTEQGYLVDEISGRNISLLYQEDGVRIVPLNLKPRVEIINNFNNGKTNALIITRAGVSGISAHASADYKEQQQRCMVELEISPNPANRLQFHGRVNRRNQLSIPELWAIVTDLPAEKRIVEYQDKKMKALKALVMGEEIEKINIISYQGNYIALEYLLNNRKVAKFLGISLMDYETSLNDITYPFVNKIMQRLFMLPDEIQEEIINMLHLGIDKFNESYDTELNLLRNVNVDGLFKNENVLKESVFSNEIYLTEWTEYYCPQKDKEVVLNNVNRDFNKKDFDNILNARKHVFGMNMLYWNFFQNVLSKLDIYKGIRAIHPYTKQIIDGIILDVDCGNSDYNYFYPSNYIIKLFDKKDSCIKKIWLGDFILNQDNLIISNNKMSLNIEIPNMIIKNFAILLGNPILLSIYQNIYKLGKWITFEDIKKEKHNGLFLSGPERNNILDNNLLLLSPEQAIVASYVSKDKPLVDHFKTEKANIQIYVHESGCDVIIGKTFWDGQWNDFAMKKHFGQTKWKQGYIHAFIAKNKINALFFALYKRNIYFFLDKSYKEWYIKNINKFLHNLIPMQQQ